MKVSTDESKIDELLTRGTQDIFIREHLRKALLSGEQLRIKLGIDPTGPDIHLGRAVALRKLKSFQDLGHKIVLIIGDFTAKIGDPSDKLEKRPMLADKQIKKNLKDYLKQIKKVIDISKCEIQYNSKWLAKMSYLEMARLLECFTVQQMSKRRNFKERLEKGKDIFVVEFMYPALQGYDSVAVKADVEIGGFDQLFNLKAGRTVQKRYGEKEQDIMTVSMLEGTDGRKMSSSWGNVISILDTADNMFIKVMAVKDNLIIKYFTLCTDLPLFEISELKNKLEKKVNPRDIKMKLAYEIVKIYHGEKKAKLAEANFINTFQKGEIPEEMEEIAGKREELLGDVLVKSKVLKSKSEWRRLVNASGIHDLGNRQSITDPYFRLTSDIILKIGKKRFVKISVK